MAYDGIVTYAISAELANTLILGKIEKIYQPSSEDILIHIHTQKGNFKLLFSVSSKSARVCLTDEKYPNPDTPPVFCMLLRKHLQGGRITAIRQVGSERIIEIDIESQNELGFSLNRRIVAEIMSKHSNVVLMDIESGRVIDALKRLSIDVNTYRQILPGIIYKYPPAQNKIPFKSLTHDTELPHDEKAIMRKISGISPTIAKEALRYCREKENANISSTRPAARLVEIISSIDNDSYSPLIYSDQNGQNREFHLTELYDFTGEQVQRFSSANECVDKFYYQADLSNIIKQKSAALSKTMNASLNKALLKKKKLNEDVLKAKQAEIYKLYGELITASLHNIKAGADKVSVYNYYTNEMLDIPMDPKLSPAKNSQKYFKKYSKSRTAIKKKQIQLDENQREIYYIESVLQTLNNISSPDDIDAIKAELQETGYVRKATKSNRKNARINPKPIQYIIGDNITVLVGHNNTENDYITTKLARKTDLWLHTKDIPGSHVLVRLPEGSRFDSIKEEIIRQAASIAAYHSKSSSGSNVPVDYVQAKYVKKPSGAKPGMVIFTNNKTIYVDPKLPPEK